MIIRLISGVIELIDYVLAEKIGVILSKRGDPLFTPRKVRSGERIDYPPSTMGVRMIFSLEASKLKI
jgi:hypothetical protein